jgi:peptidoglycan hydrolase CwlO-like protein
METNILISAVTLGAVIIGAIVNVTSLMNKRESKAAANGRLEEKLDNIYVEVKDIRDSQKDNVKMLTDHEKRIAKTEEMAKSAHHRIDRLENKEDREMIL